MTVSQPQPEGQQAESIDLTEIDFGELSEDPSGICEHLKRLEVYQTREDIRELVDGLENEINERQKGGVELTPDEIEGMIAEFYSAYEELLNKKEPEPPAPETPITPEQQELKAKVEKSHEAMESALTRFGITSTKDLAGREHDIPTWDKIASRFTTEKLDAIKEFKNPQLLLIPMGHTDSEIIARIDENKATQGLSMPNQLDTFRSAKFDNIAYFPDEITCKVTKNGNKKTYEMEYKGGSTREEVRQSLEQTTSDSTATPGWMIVVVDDIPDMPADAISSDTDANGNKYWGKKAEAWVSELNNERNKDNTRKFEGFTPEVALILEMLGLSKNPPTPVDRKTYNALLGTAFTDSKNMPCSDWVDGRVSLCGFDPGIAIAILRGRLLVRI